MIETGEILQTMRMIQEENFDIRTITLGINLLDCSDPDAEKCARKVYEKICRKAEHLVQTGEEIETEFGIPIVNKRISGNHFTVNFLGLPVTKIESACKLSHYKHVKSLFPSGFLKWTRILEFRI